MRSSSAVTGTSADAGRRRGRRSGRDDDDEGVPPLEECRFPLIGTGPAPTFPSDLGSASTGFGPPDVRPAHGRRE